MTVFSKEQLAAIVKTAALDVPDGHKNAIVGGVDESGAQVIVSVKLDTQNRWTAQGAIRHDWTGKNFAGGELIYSW